MTHSPNRGRLAVDINGNWRLYTNTLPERSRAIGTVTRDGYDAGALVLLEATGIYVQVNAGAIRNLDQRAIDAIVSEQRSSHGGAGRGQGRKAADGVSGVRRVNVTLDDASIQRLRAHGDGDLSLGIRRAAKMLTTE